MNIKELLPMYDTIMPVIYIAISILSCLIIVTYILSFWFIFKKENIKEIYSLIPFYNIYKIFEIIKIPFYTIFIPLVNLVVLVVVPYKLLKRYKRPKWMMTLSIFLPFVFMPYIAFSNRCAKPKDMKTAIRTLFELENIENNLESNLDIDDLSFSEDLNLGKSIKESAFTSETEKMIDNIEKNSIVDDYYFENEIVDEELEKKVEKDTGAIDDNIEEIIEIFEQEENSLSASSIDTIDEQLRNNENIKHVDNAKYEEYKKREASNESIAFGGKNKEENATHNKNETLKCPICGSSLIGANGYCPGCGLKI